MLRSHNSIFNLFKLGQFFSSKIKKDFLLLIFLSLVTSIFDVLSVASVIPFLGSLTGLGSDLSQNKSLIFMSDGLNPIIQSMIILSIVVLLASSTRIYTLYYSTKLTSKFSHLISKDIFKARFGTSFEHIIKTDIKVSTAELVLYTTKTVESLNYFSKLLTSLFISLLICSFLIITRPVISIATLSIIGCLYILLGLDSRKKMNTLSKRITKYTENQIQTIQEIYGMSRNLYLDNSFDSISKDYYNSDYKNRKLYALSEFLGSYPRFVVESVAIVIISLMTVLLVTINKSLEYNIIPFLGAFAFASQRLLPAVQAIYSNWAGIKANDEFVKKIIYTLKTRKKPTKYIPHHGQRITNIIFENLYFKYNSKKDINPIINNFSYEFKSGDRIAIIGKTGIGKTTFLDLIACLRNPSKGKLLFKDANENLILDNVKSNNKIIQTVSNCALIPQSCYVINGTIAENISLSSSDVILDYKKLDYAAKISNLDDFIDLKDKGYNFNPMQGGYSLSGGQLQRLTIARAIYKMSPILLMDEATSALDKKTSIKIIKNIFCQKHIDFIFAITHSNYYLEYFSHIIEFEENGKIKIHENKKSTY